MSEINSIFNNEVRYHEVRYEAAQKEEPIRMYKRAKVDEKIVRRTLARVWTRILEDYARPGVSIPSAPEAKKELIEKGVAAAAKAVADEHWFVSRSMAAAEIRPRVEQEFNRFDLEGFLKEVREAQTHPEKIPHLRHQIESCVLGWG